MLVVLGFLILIVSFVIAFWSMIGEERKQRKAVLQAELPEEEVVQEEKSSSLTKDQILKIAASGAFQEPSDKAAEAPKEPEVPAIPQALPQQVQWDEKSFPWEQRDSTPVVNTPIVKEPLSEIQNRDSLTGEIKIPRDGK